MLIQWKKNEPRAVSIAETSASVLMVSRTGNMTRTTSLKPFSSVQETPARTCQCPRTREIDKES